MSDDEAVRYLLDRAALEDLLCTYARGIDRGRPELVASVYAEDAHFRSLAGRRSFVRLLLAEVSDRCRLRPACVVQVTVDADRSGYRRCSRDRE
jgi:hypothetical protein